MDEGLGCGCFEDGDEEHVSWRSLTPNIFHTNYCPLTNPFAASKLSLVDQFWTTGPRVTRSPSRSSQRTVSRMPKEQCLLCEDEKKSTFIFWITGGRSRVTQPDATKDTPLMSTAGDIGRVGNAIIGQSVSEFDKDWENEYVVGTDCVSVRCRWVVLSDKWTFHAHCTYYKVIKSPRTPLPCRRSRLYRQLPHGRQILPPARG